MKSGMKNRNGMAKRPQRPNLKGLNATGAGGSTSAAAALPANGETWPAEAPKAVISGKRRNGNVARLSKEVRDRLNVMIEDGVPYAQILKELGKDGEGISVSNLSRWKDGGHQDWLAERAFVEQLRARQETPRALVKDFDATEVNHAALQLGTLHIFEAMRELRAGPLKEKLGGDCEAFARLVNALARVSRETMQLQKYRETRTKTGTTLRRLDAKRKLEESEARAIVCKVDDILGVPHMSDSSADELAESRVFAEDLPGPGERAEEDCQPPACPLDSTAAAVDSGRFPSSAEASDLPFV
jgi:hypothetical protein